MHEQFEQLQYAQPIPENSTQTRQEHLNLLDDDIQGFSDLILKTSATTYATVSAV